MGTDDWECGECGARIQSADRPRVCPVCGTAGGSTVAATPHTEEDTESGHFQRKWFEAGFEHPLAVAVADGRLPP